MTALTIALNGEKSQPRILKKVHTRIIKSFMDLIIMHKLKDGAASGYDIISFIAQKYGILISSGTVYSLLYSLERTQLIDGVWMERKRVYKLTAKGQQTLEAIHDSKDAINSLISSVVGGF
jgi:DNA-binding PadR family transcriptional regulator